VVFPVGELDHQVRRQLATCFYPDTHANR
jgi:hypothetical protein